MKLSSLALGPDSTPTFAGLILSGLTASRLMYTDSDKKLSSVASLSAWIAGTSNQVVVADDSDGTITLSTPQDIHTGASPTFADLTLSSPVNIYALSHDSFADFVANEHIDHTTVSISAGGILSGGGDISANRTISLAHGDVDHDQTTNFVANEHIDWTNATADLLTTGKATIDGLVVHADGTSNMFFGINTGNFTSTSQRNVGIGENTLNAITSGTDNVAVGVNSLAALTSGEQNFGLGRLALNACTEGLANVAIGASALRTLTTTSYNIGIGAAALRDNIGSRNIGIGTTALALNSTGNDNVAIGYLSGYNCTGIRNLFLGAYCGWRQTATSDMFMVDNRNRADAATELSNALMVGTMALLPANQSLRINAATQIIGALDVNQKAYITPIGGYAIKLTNRTGGSTVAGQLVKADTATNDAVILTAADDDECFGVFLDSGVADGSEAWVVVAGIADVAMADNTAATRGNWVETSEAGYADATSATPAAAPAHFQEIGHCIETVAAGGAGTHILARCVLHFN
jgi:hypothetical protein